MGLSCIGNEQIGACLEAQLCIIKRGNCLIHPLMYSHINEISKILLKFEFGILLHQKICQIPVNILRILKSKDTPTHHNNPVLEPQSNQSKRNVWISNSVLNLQILKFGHFHLSACVLSFPLPSLTFETNQNQPSVAEVEHISHCSNISLKEQVKISLHQPRISLTSTYLHSS